MKKIVHESAKYHVTGEAVYIDDMLVNEQCLHGVLYTSPIAHGKIKSYDLSAAKALSGIHAILTYKDIPGHNQMGPIFHDEVVLAEDKVEFIGQAIFLIAAENEEIAEEAKRLIKIEFEELEPVLTIEKSMELGNLIQPPRQKILLKIFFTLVVKNIGILKHKQHYAFPAKDKKLKFTVRLKILQKFKQLFQKF